MYAKKGYDAMKHRRLMILVCLGLSFCDFCGLETLNQFQELGIAAGFLMGTYLLAKSEAQGYPIVAKVFRASESRR
jgi:hypothetical protein